MSLTEDLERLVGAGELPADDINAPAELLAELGFEIAGDRVLVPAVERLDAARIRDALKPRARRWLAGFEVRSIVGSTSDLLLERAHRGSVDGFVMTAELQLGGRGRRGRRWLSPFARNVAVSAGFAFPIAPAEMGGFSLAIGLAVVDVLERMEVPGVALKWPNDVLLDGRKLCGILIDLVAAPAGVQVVVGVGVNVALPRAALAQIDQPVTDLSTAGVGVSRNQLVAELTSSLVDFAGGFAESGFGPMVAAYDAHHYYHLRRCRVLEGERSTSGTVRGVTARGELVLETPAGVRRFGAGEVSLRE